MRNCGANWDLRAAEKKNYPDDTKILPSLYHWNLFKVMGVGVSGNTPTP